MTTASRDVREIPPWVRRAALLAALTPLPASLWRLPLIFGASMGMDVDFDDSMMAHPFWVRFGYLVGLGVLSDGLAYLTLGLVRSWGEWWPRFVPMIGGRRVPTWFAVGVAASGAIAVTIMAWQAAQHWGRSTAPMTDGWRALMTACYAPLLAWGPLVLVVTAHYAWRRRARLSRRWWRVPADRPGCR